MRHFRKFLLFLFFFSWASLSPPVYAQLGPYHGRVIDAETKQPIIDAAVLAVWWQESGFLVPHPTEAVYDAQETLTDLNGNFNVPGLVGTPIAKITQVRFTIFKPGYDAYKAGSLKPSSLPQEIKERFQLTDRVYEKDGVMVVELRPLKTPEERTRNTYGILPIPCRPNDVSQFCVPGEKYPNLIKLLNDEELSLGLKPTRVPRGGRQ